MTTDSDDPSMILLNAAQINTKSEDAKALRQDVGSFEGKRMHIVKFRDAVRPEWFKMLADSGVEVIDYIPFNSYLVYGDSVSLQRIQGLSKQAASPIEWEGQYKDEYRLSPDLYVSTGDKASPRSLASMQFQVQLFKDDAVNSETLALIKSWQTTPIKGQQEIMRYVNLVVGLDEESLGKLAGRPDVISIHPYLDKQKFDERQDIIITGDLTGNVPNPQSYLTYLANKGFTQAQFDASGFAVDVTDSGIDNATPANPTQFLLRKLGDPTSTSRYIYSRLEGTANSGSTTSGCDGHGNLNSTIVAGYVPTAAPFNAFPHMDASGYHFGLGVAPFVKVGSSVIFDPSTFTNPVYANLQSRAYNDGARVSTNSWGSSLNTYTTDSQAYDSLVRDAQQAGSPFPTAGNQEMVIVFAAGNGGSGANTVGEPGTGKNVITVGASENVQAFGGADQCGTTDAEADSANDIVGFSSRGPTSDGRKKPDIVAPGTHVSGGVGQASVVSPVTGNGAQLACFDATGVCAGTGTNNFFPTGQQWYTASSGTSHSTPATAGAAALLRQHFINLGQTPPSAAMTKALLLSSARYMNGTGANDNLYSNNQGMGMVNLNGYFDIFARAKILRDQVAADKFTASGQQRIFAGTVVDNTKPFRVTLAYSDAPGSTTGNAWVNNLDLEVTVGGNTYLGNVFTGGNSTTGGTADARNNVESVFLPAGVSGPFVVKVKATNIAGNGVPNDADALDQDFALVVQNANEVPTAVIQTNSVAITAENGTPANNVPDPGETLTVNLDLQNVGTGNASNVTATLQATGGVTNPSATQNYGAMAANGAPVSKPFTFTVSPSVTCGSSITLTWQISDGTNNSTYTKTYATGTPVTSLTQNFDGVTAPALPAGWVSTASGSNTGWVTSTTSPNSAPNSAFSADPSSVGDGQLETPSMSINSASAHLKFKLNFNTEASSTPTTGYDGGVVEMKLGSGAYQDILAAGGSFVTGAYTRTISSSFSSPIAGRQAWSGTSGGWIDVDILLPASANGQTATFKWRMASDSSVSGNGIFIDDVQVVAGTSCANVSVTVKSRADYDGDGKTDVSVFRPSTGDWFINRSTAGFTVPNWGIASDVITPGDYDGDGKADVAVFRGSSSTWYILQSSNATPSITVFGAVGDVPVAGDYDGDGKTDLAVFRASTNQWIVRNSNGGSVTTTVFGATGDVPVRADYNGDGKTDIAVFRPSTNTWWIANSGGAVTATAFGATGDLPVPADYDGDNKEDIAVFRPSTGQWWTLNSTNGSVTAPVFGTTGDVPVPGDYDGDGKDDQAVYRAGTWWVNKSTGGFQTTTFGLTTDRPTPAAYIP
ncbi:MAG: S8 family serine peptidase [Acidobacteria bacterium]|nr:S8 family serine peptidase [Acidobacteriota bacterium]